MNRGIHSNLMIDAVREGSLETIRELINAFGLKYRPEWSEGYVLLCDALKNNHTEVAKLLLTSGSKVNSKNRKPTNTALHFAVKNGDLTVVKMILDKGAIINAKNKYDQTPLYNAVQCSKKMEIIELLLKYGANVNARDDDGSSPLHVAIEKGCLQIIECLLKYKADVNCVLTSKWSNGYAPLHLAVEQGNKEAVTLLLNRGANVDAKEKIDSLTPLHIAVKKGFTHIAEDLLNHGANIYSLTLKEGYMPLQVAIKSGRHTVVKLLLQHGAKVDNQDKYGTTVLHDAVKTGNLTIVEDILKYCPDINNRSNRSSLTTAVCSYGKNENMIEALLDFGLTFNPEAANNPELLHAAVEKGYLKIVEDLLLRYGADANTCIKGFTPLHTATKDKHKEMVKLLIRCKADINSEFEAGKTPIFYAIENADLEMTELLLMNGANVKDNPRILNVAVTKECTGIVETLLQHGADINASDEYGKTALHFTALKENMFDFLLNPDSDPDDSVKGEITKLLLRKGANVNSQTKKGSTALHFATKNGYAKVVEALLEYNANVNSETENDMTSLFSSSENGIEDPFTMLLNKGANVHAKKNRITALHFAIKNGDKQLVKALLEHGAKVHFEIKNEIDTPLHLAVQKGNHEIVETILKFGADVDSRDDDGRTALHIACKEGHNKVVATLLEYGVDINITCRKNYTPLDYAFVGIQSFYRQVNRYNSSDDDDDCYYDSNRGICGCEVTHETLQCHIVKMKTANFYVSKNNLRSITYKIVSENTLPSIVYNIRNLQDNCKKEIANMKSETIHNTNISFYDILTKGKNSLAIYMRNENIVRILKSKDYETKFPIYASMIKSQFRKGVERNELIEQGNTIFHKLFPELSHDTKLSDCTDNIFSYLSVEDFKNLIDACNPLGISNAYTNINNVVES